MSETTGCAKCGSTRVIPDAHLRDRHHHEISSEIEVEVYKSPDAMMFKGRTRSDARALVCADCGFVELYAKEPKVLWEAYEDSRRG